MLKTQAQNSHSSLRRAPPQLRLHNHPTPPHFTGKERDQESGNDYFGARYYASTIGRFMSPDDPFEDQDFSDPQSWNLYSYVHNNPLVNTDPTGNDCVNGSNASNGSILVQTTSDSAACLKGFTYVNGTVDPNSVTYSNGQLGFNISNYADGSGIAASVTMASGSQLDPDTLKAGVFGSPSASTWRNSAGVVNVAGGVEMSAIALAMPEMFAGSVADTTVAAAIRGATKAVDYATKLANWKKVPPGQKMLLDEWLGSVKGSGGTPGPMSPNLTKETIEAYRDVSTAAGNVGRDGVGSQAARLPIIDQALSKMK